jgi:hypothetical protein
MSAAIRSSFLMAIVALAYPGAALGGMPSPTLADVERALGLTDMTRMRLEVISAALLIAMLGAAMIQRIWNSLRKDFTILPRLSYAKASGIVVLWGLLFALVLTMISGARELMTPGAWEKSGLTYHLAGEPPPDVERQIAARVGAIRRLGYALREYARTHKGRYPAPGTTSEIPEILWRLPAPSVGRYVYVGGLQDPDHEDRLGVPLAYEPDEVGPDRLVLLTDGLTLWLPAAEIQRVLSRRGP